MSNDCNNCYYCQEHDTGFKSCNNKTIGRTGITDCPQWLSNNHCNDCRYANSNGVECNYSKHHDGENRLAVTKQYPHSCSAWESKIPISSNLIKSCRKCGHNEDNYCCTNPGVRINIDKYLLDRRDELCDRWIPIEPNSNNHQPINKNLLKEIRELLK